MIWSLLDHPRTTLWFVANLVTGICYLHLPLAMQSWFQRIESGGFRVIAYMFQVFIVSCGLHHLIMLRHFAHHPTDWPQVTVDLSMALASVVTSLVVIRYRRNLRQAFRALFRQVEKSLQGEADRVRADPHTD